MPAFSMRADPLELQFDCDLAQLPDDLAARFFPLAADEALARFVEAAGSVRHGALRRWAFSQLRRWWSDYDTYGLLGMYRMHLLSTPQWAALLDRPLAAAPRGRLLDVGAGRGDVTRALLPLFATCDATEKARFLRRELARLPLQVVPWDLCTDPVPPDQRYDVVACLNVIDRVSYPRTLIAHARDALAPDGRLVVAVPLPLRPHVDVGGATVSPEQPLPDPGDRWEETAAGLARDFFAPLGLRVERLGRAPYVSHGDRAGRVLTLDDALFVLRPGR